MKINLVILCIFICFNTFATNHYFSAHGSDSSDGLTAATAQRSIDKLNASFSSYSPGDSVLFKRGDVFFGEIVISRSGTQSSPIVFGAYGTGTNPEITGFETVNGWAKVGEKIWEVHVDHVKSSVNIIIRDNRILPLGRYPNFTAANEGYLQVITTDIAKTGGTSNITGSPENSKTNWKGAELVFRTQRWIIQKTKITGYSGERISYVQPTSNTYKNLAGFGYFFQRDSRTLDVDGEWWYDTSKSKLRIFSEKDPSSAVIKISICDTLLYSIGKSNIKVNDLKFTGANTEAIYFRAGANISITNCLVEFGGQNAITGWFCKNISVENCKLTNCLNGGINLRNSGAEPNYAQRAIGNIIDSIGMIAGMALDGDDPQYGRSGITGYGNGTSILNNTLGWCGYVGVEWFGSDVNIKYNYIHDCLQNRDDGGMIYTFEKFPDGRPIPKRHNRNIVSNILISAPGDNNGTPANSNLTSARGIYFDMNTYNVLADSNTIAYCHGSALYSNSGRYITFTNNLCFKNTFSHTFNRFTNDSVISGINVKNNIFIPYRMGFSDLMIDKPERISRDQDIARMGVVDNNVYSLLSETEDSSVISTVLDSAGKGFSSVATSFSRLKSTTGIESRSSKIINNADFQFNPTSKPFAYSLGDKPKKLIDGTPVDKSFILQPHRGYIFLSAQ